VDIVVTSPPYGDSQTTVAYGQFSRLVLQWLGYDDETAKSIDRRALGGRLAPTEPRYESPSLARALAAIGDACPKRAAQVKQFYDDFAQCIPELSRVVRAGGYGCFVVGNRTVKGVRLPTRPYPLSRLPPASAGRTSQRTTATSRTSGCPCATAPPTSQATSRRR
jgi:site-specific DNA-methyltransferase (cytosine-N4-specific)